MRSKSLVSVIIIFFNAEKFIREAIDSVFAQTYKNWEMLLVDDGSTDSSTEIALSYARRHPERIRYLEHDGHCNLSLSPSRNLGINNAKGEYIAFLDADDVWFPDKIGRQCAILEAHPEAGMVYGPALIWYSWSVIPDDVDGDYIQPLGVQPNTLFKPPTLVSVYLRNMSFSPTPSAILVRRKIIERLGGFEEAFGGIYSMCEDQVIYAKFALASPIFVTSDCWYKHREHLDSVCSVVCSTGQKHASRLYYFNWLKHYLVASGVRDREIWKALRQTAWASRHPTLHRLSGIAADPGKHTRRLLRRMARRTLPDPVHVWLRSKLEIYRHSRQ